MKNPLDFVQSTWQIIASISQSGSLEHSIEQDNPMAKSTDPTPINLLNLEDRVLYDASPLIAAANEITDSLESVEDIDQLEQFQDFTSFNDATPVMPDEGVEQFLVETDPVFQQARQLLVIDERIENLDQLISDVIAEGSFDIVTLDEFSDGVKTITELLDGSQRYDAIHIIGHGKEATVQLGATELNGDNIDHYQQELSSWTSGLALGADILVYGGEVGESEEGEWFVEKFQSLVSANVASESDLSDHTTAPNIGASAGGDDAAGPAVPTGEEESVTDALLESAVTDITTFDLDDQPIATNESDYDTDSLKALVFIDAQTPNYQVLIEDLQRNNPHTDFEYVLIESSEDGLNKITETLSQFESVTSVHIVSHGSNGEIQLGNGSLNNELLRTRGNELTLWSDHLADNADILFYGCNLASTTNGMAFVDEVARLTGADIAASDDLTGNASLGGNWDFEFVVGTIETDVAFSLDVQQNWLGTLELVTVTTLDDVVNGDTTNISSLLASDGGDGISLREAIIAANGTTLADTIVLDSGTYALTLTGSGASLGDLDILYDTEIVGAADGTTIIDATSLNDRAFHVNSNSATFRNLTITGGTSTESAGGGGILSAGATVVILDNVTMQGNTAITGGAVRAAGNFTATNSTFSDNLSSGSGGALSLSSSSALQTVTIVNNTAGADGGGVYISGGTHDFENVTISGNDATGGGGIKIASGTLDLNHVTIVENSANTEGGGIHYSAGTTTVSNSIIASNSAGFNTEVSGTINSLGNNIIGDGIGDSAGGAGYHIDDLLDQTGLLLGALADNGGPVQTHELLTGSVGVDGGTGSEAVDGRGYYRNDGTSDIGAYERGATPNLEEDLVAHFEFEEGSGLDADDSANGNTGNIVNGGTWTSDSAIGGLALDLSNDSFGNNTYISVPDNPLYDFGTGEFTISLWYNMTTPTESVRLVGNIDPTGSSSGFALRAETSGEFSIERSDGLGSVYGYGDGTMDGQWHQLTVVIEPDGSVTFFNDGVETTSMNTSSNINVNSSDALNIGAVDSDAGDYEGLLDDVRLYSRALNAAEATQLAAGDISEIALDLAPTDLSSGIELNNDGGNDSFFQATDGDAILGNATEVTVEFNVQLENPALQAPHLISYRTAGEDFEFRVYLNTSDGLMLSVGGNSVLGGSAAQLRDGQPHHVAVSWDSDSGLATFYVDGELLGTNTVSAGHTIDTGGTLVVGQGQATFPAMTHTQAARGTFYDVRIWDDVRSEAEISLNYQQKIDAGSLPSGLIANWQMDGFDATHQVVDIVGGNNLSIGHVGETRIESWTNQVGGVTATGNTLTYVDDGAPEGWGSQINSPNVSTLGYTDDYTIRFTLDNTTNYAWTVGLGSTESGPNFTDPEFAIFVDHIGDPGNVDIRHNGTTVGTYDIDFVPGGEFGFYVNGTTLEYQYDGVTFATDTIPGSTDWYIDTGFYLRTSDATYNNQDDYSLSNFHIIDGNDVSASGFTSSTPADDLNIDEDSANGTTVGVVIPSDSDLPNDVALDGRFTDQNIAGTFQTFTSPATFGDWNVTNNQAVVYNDVSEFAFTPLAGRGVELGNVAGPGTIEQTLDTVTGQTYQVTFALAGDFSAGEIEKNLESRPTERPRTSRLSK